MLDYNASLESFSPRKATIFQKKDGILGREKVALDTHCHFYLVNESRSHHQTNSPCIIA